MENNLNWFPGHMQKTTRLLQEMIKQIDLIIQIVDARAPNISSNDNFLKEINTNKPILKIALKDDFLDDENRIENDDILFTSILNKKFKKTVISKIRNIMDKKIEQQKLKGFVNPKIYIIVVGLPNVGKSTFINKLANKSQLITSNVPGITRKKIWLNVNDWIDMLDTPGVLYKKIKTFENLSILALIKTIKWDILETRKYEIMEWGYNFYKNNYLLFWNQYYEIVSNNFEEFINQYCELKKFYLKKGVFNYSQAIEKLYLDFTENKICKVNYEKK
ncbi:MAG: ribosome biogenesis GTPase YlqF [Mycoplasmoidaceae bacterium]